MLKTKNEIDLLNSQIINTIQDLIKNNEAEKVQKYQELREKRSEILNRPNDPELEQDFRRICSVYGLNACVNDPILEQAYQDYTNAYRQKSSLYTIIGNGNRAKLIIYDTENDSKEVRIVKTPEPLDNGTCIAQLPNDNLFCFGCEEPLSGVRESLIKIFFIKYLYIKKIICSLIWGFWAKNRDLLMVCSHTEGGELARIETNLGVFIGAVTFTESVITWGKLEEVIRSQSLIILE